MLRKRSVTLAGHATSLALEEDFWAVLDEAARAEGVSLARLIARIDEMRARHDPDAPLSSACRVWVLRRVLEGPVSPERAGPLPSGPRAD
ncbi:aryl-sulfate sulfotransferase [Alkalicaulis satelles]|uniref:Aryl-sulfate sulfotransferase n=1 Tax=Alkalicaulis satelles TaxID=2609175 RepID=A0A5M6ZA36_9PROT|nr:ribbon-helix-helix domain-containing protein [Alkalicaulis satelles]KAA5801559.1 aryl-sulfate sulfotransferase [Alkalicaulis satelles]